MKKICYRIISAIFVIVLCFSAAACKNNASSQKLSGKYLILSATENGQNVLSDFTVFTVEFSEDYKMTVKCGYLGLPVTRNSTYFYDGTTVTETYGSNKYAYKFVNGNLVTDIDDYGSVINVILKKESEEQTDATVDFESVLFGSDMSDTKYYNYCPAIITDSDSDGNEIMHVWYCTNRDDGVIMDYIGYRKGVKQKNDKWLFSEEKIVLEPTPDTWDSRHTCDPTVIKGEFALGGKTYSYLMAYLGCTTEDYSNNETGIAVADNPEGPWVKADNLNPIVPWAAECASGTWGTGMPSLVSIDGKGEVLLFYQSSTRGTGIERWDLSNLDAPDLTAKYNVSLQHTGVVNSQGITCRIGIPDFAYDSVRKRFYACGVTNEKNPADVTKTLVNSHTFVAYIENVEDTESLSAMLEKGGYKWKMAGYVGPSDTGFERNHNPGLVKSIYGYIPDSDKIALMVSTGHNSWANENIFTYRLYGAYVSVS